MDANKTAKQLSKKTAAALQLKKSADKERRSAEKDLARNQDSAARHMAKLVELQAAETTQDATDQLHAGNAEDAVRTVADSAIDKSTRSRASNRTANKSATKKATSSSRGAGTRKPVTKRASATTDPSAKQTAASRGTGSRSTTKSSTAIRTAAKSPAKRSPTKRTARGRN